ncbi:MAG: hypothetical protein A3A43_01765 [Candidatus Liptonbacteria bacterium RIFCSPLOWO2_01_FULL_56_20]|uniref:Type II secretion system protein GspG C-terminal domain-containing protein n=1 Tax=Candidatus Liptonbacteria bacterium RIFCSPLOWO2_01_FULL_56_20 TaxID=1798652 RepID=A0A1G2CJR0_9BACT|nr:MAG: hypothetical protein UY96_C0001G0011 [Parcubacteria group bacterium GW2011_GWB1_56_8]OGY97648.1 MAG: hypothetical protein A2681_02975 [Candidatus Liptonbacteria bacterium RIFCSPHIGHO2_01_FULL_56_18b]OGZ01615.1 MAG: hypothetical protein A3A43_01765 [Candidatus Liptonbacteria bacterium RIFCSPLOWO2_01_FULL_56_20]
MQQNRNQEARGFTLIELLIVIAIVTILAVVVVVALNPAELLRQARDSNRVSDLATLRSAIALYLADVVNPNLASSSYGYSSCYLSTYAGNGTASSGCGVFVTVGQGNGGQNASFTLANYRKADATGWIPINFNVISSGAPFGNLPVDPRNDYLFYYAYAATTTNLTFEIDAKMESSKYGFNNGLGGDVVSNDGGDSTSTYEVGNAAGLAL